MKKLQVLGPGCPKCRKLAENAEAAAKAAGVPYQLEKVTDITQIISFGMINTPALVVDGVVRVSGRIPGVEEIKKILSGGEIKR